jgi:hypothetical protein
MTAKDDGRALPWKHFPVESAQFQPRIFKAARRGALKTVHRLQRLQLRSRAACYLAVRKVTQDTWGKKTAGVDGVKARSPRQRLDLAASLTLTATAQPTRRVRQGPTLNQVVAASAARLVEQLRAGTCVWMGAYFDLNAGTLRPVPTEPATVAAIAGFPRNAVAPPSGRAASAVA